jgi:CRISPR-associated protein Cas2
MLKAQLLEEIDPEKDSLRFYYLGNSYENKIEYFGTKETIKQEGILML